MRTSGIFEGLAERLREIQTAEGRGSQMQAPECCGVCLGPLVDGDCPICLGQPITGPGHPECPGCGSEVPVGETCWCGFDWMDIGS